MGRPVSGAAAVSGSSVSGFVGAGSVGLSAGNPVVGDEADISGIGVKEHEGRLSTDLVADALVVAERFNKEVEVDELAGSALKVVASPSGDLVAESSVVDFRVEREDGSWAEADSSLVTSGGRLAARVSATDASFSAGSSLELLRLCDGDLWFAFEWGSVLPVPRVVGEFALYEDVWPGLDIVARAFEGGAGVYFVVKTPQAAWRVAETGISLKVRACDGLRLGRDADGRLGVLNVEGRVAFEIDDLFMWDSAASGGGVSPVEAVDFAGDGLWVAVDARASGDVLGIFADAEWLTSAERVFPVVIDPVASTCQGRGLCVKDVRSASADVVRVLGSDNARNRNGFADGVGYVGLNGWPDERGVVGGEVEEIWLSMPLPADVYSSQVSGVSFSITQKSSPKHVCGNARDSFGVKLFQTGAVSAATTWASRPAVNHEIGVNNLAAGYYGSPSKCAPRQQVWDSTAFPKFVDVVQWFVNRPGSGSIGFALKSTHPSNRDGWRVYDLKTKRPTLTITYNHRPSVPTNVNLGSLKARPDRGGVYYTANNFVDVFATATDRQNRSLYLTARVDGKSRDNAWYQNGEFHSGKVGRVRVENLTPNKVMSIEVNAHDGYMASDYAATVLKVMYLPDIPPAPSLVSVLPAPQLVNGSKWYLAGVKYRFLFQADKDVVDYIKVSGGGGCAQPARAVVDAATSLAEFSCVPVISGRLQDLEVTSVSLAGKETAAGGAAVVPFSVWSDAKPVHRWLFDGDGVDQLGAVGFDTGGVSFEPGRASWDSAADQALRLGAAPVSSQGAGFDAGLSGAVSLWAKWDSDAGCVDVCPVATVVDGEGRPVFVLAVKNEAGQLRWAFSANESASGTPVFSRWAISQQVTAGVFVHVAGIVNHLSDGQARLRLWVLENAGSMGEVDITLARPSSGGRIVLGGRLAGFSGVFCGVIDDVIVASGNATADRAAEWKDMPLPY